MPRWRKATWALIVWCVLILIWLIGGAGASNCAGDPACEAGTGIGLFVVALIGFFGFLFFSLIWFMSRPKTRTCPRCGEDVKKGRMTCPSCQFDFSSLGQAQTAGGPPPPPPSYPPPPSGPRA
jgi:hypothetical protein